MACGGGFGHRQAGSRPMLNRIFMIAGIAILLAPPAAAQLPAGFEDSAHIPGITNPIAMAYAPDGRLFICERAGRIRIYKDEQLLPTAFGQLNVSTSSERGLLGIAID